MSGRTFTVREIPSERTTIRLDIEHPNPSTRVDALRRIKSPFERHELLLERPSQRDVCIALARKLATHGVNGLLGIAEQLKENKFELIGMIVDIDPKHGIVYETTRSPAYVAVCDILAENIHSLKAHKPEIGLPALVHIAVGSTDELARTTAVNYLKDLNAHSHLTAVATHSEYADTQRYAREKLGI